MNDYTKQAEQFLADTGTEFSIVYLYTGQHFDDDKESRDVYQFTLKNKRGIYSAKFGNSINNTEARALFSEYGKRTPIVGGWSKPSELKKAMKHKRILEDKSYLPPSAYDILACLTKYDPGTFKNFCAEYGYDTDSIKAQKVYFAVQNEWDGVRKLFNPEQLEQLAEIN